MNLRSIPAGLFSSRDPGVLDQIMAPAELILDNYIRGVYRDGPFDDARFLRAGVQRVLSQSVSGRDFLQLTAEVLNAPIARSSFFDSLHSSRRCRLLDELNHQLVEREQPGMVDLLAGFPELKDRPIHAVDGHHLAHAVHSPADEQEEYVSSNSLYVLCLHSGVSAHRN